MKWFRAVSLLSVVALVLPLVARAADLPLMSPGWSLVPEECRDCACGFAAVMGMIQNLMNAGISVGVFVAVAIMTWAGILYITTPTNPEARGQASKMLLNAVIGMLIILSAWLIVDFVMKVLYSGADGQQGKFGPWNSILTGGDTCVKSTTVKPLFSGAITAGQITATTGTETGGTTVTGGPVGPMCSPPVTQSNPCSVTNMQNSCMSSRPSDAAIVCNMESRGNPRIESGSDKLNGGRGPSYSIGLWQINLTVHKVKKGNTVLNCPAAFTNPCSRAYYTDPENHPGWCNSSIKAGNCGSVTCQELYTQCVEAAKDPVVSTAAACAMDTNHDFSDWACSASRCSIAGARTLTGGCAPGK